MDQDYQLALLLQKELDNEVPGSTMETWKGKENYAKNSLKKTESLVDPQWEFIDPTPDVHALFLQFNDKFFWGKLRSVEVRWSPRMTSCAGVCVYQGRSGFCSVRLSLPLLKLRPRKDLVETLLHEMIHAFLFVTKNNRDRDGHGPEFHKHMNRINQEAGTRISVYHSFHDEVRVYQQHWWRCSGPCQHKPPFFGMVRRSMNRAPGPYDRWWAQHEATCGGKYIKVKEPENTKKKSADSKSNTADPTKNGKRDIRTFFPTSGSLMKPGAGRGTAASTPSTIGVPKPNYPFKHNAPAITNTSGIIPGTLFKKTTPKNVHGFSTGEASSFKPVANPAVNNVFGFGDLQGQGRKQPSGSSQPSGSGKGYTLGGTGKPPYKKAGGAYGGMLANKGGGTLVISGTSTKPHDSQGSLNNPRSSTTATINSSQVFSGSGYVLGGKVENKPRALDNAAGQSIQGSPFKKRNSFQKNDHPLFTEKVGGSRTVTEPTKRLSPNSLKHSPVKKKLHNEEASISTQPISVICPACSQKVLETEINSHLDMCINSFNSNSDNVILLNDSDDVILLNDSDDVILLSDSDDSSPVKGKRSVDQGSLVDCPGCGKKVLDKHLDSHLASCLINTLEDNDVLCESESGTKCPICGESVPASDMDKHLENCASCSVQDLSGVFDEDMTDEEEDAAVGSPSQRVSESGERVYPCPCCLALIETSKMNNHLDQCVV